jgi:AcrR family transcriptional regulator
MTAKRTPRTASSVKLRTAVVPARPRGRRSREEAARTRQRILDRAEKLFARKGYSAVSTRELARACGVHPYTVQHHFGSKPKLYEAVLCRWDEPIREMTLRHSGAASGVPQEIGDAVDELLDFLLEKRDWVTLNMRSRLGEGLPRGVASADPSWVRFLSDVRPGGAASRRATSGDVESSLLFITIEGILHQHVTSQARYRELLGRDLGDAELRRMVKRHLAAVIGAIVGRTGSGPA